MVALQDYMKGIRIPWRVFGPGLAALVFLSVSAGCSPAAKKDAYLERANRYYDQHQFEQARLEYINVLKLDPKQPQALHRLGVILYESGQMPMAYAVLRQSQEVDPGNSDVRLKLARIYLAGMQPNLARVEALAVLEKEPGNEHGLLILTETAADLEQMKDAERRLEALRQNGDTAVVHLGLGNLALRRNDLAAAEAELTQARIMDPRSSLVEFALANLRWRQDRIADAEQAFQSALESAPDDWQIRLRWADLHLTQGKLAEARGDVEWITRKYPNHLPAMFSLARIAFLEKKHDECADLLKRLQTADPSHPDPALLRAQLSFVQNKPEEAVAELERLRDRHPQSARFHYELGMAYLRTQAVPKAVTSLERAISADPKFDPAILLLAEVQLRRGEPNAAIRSLTALVERSPNVAQAHALLAEAFRGQQRFDEALAACARWKALAPSTPQPLHFAGLVLRQQQKEAEARVQFEAALQLAPGFLPAIEQLTELDLRENKTAAAVNRAENLVTANPKATAPLLLLAKIHVAQRALDKAETALLKVLELDPGASNASMLLAQVYVASNRRDEALKKLQDSVAKNPANPAALIQIGWIQQDAKEYTKAREAYEKVLALTPKSAVALNNLAYICAEYLGDIEAGFRHAKAARDAAPDDPSVADTLGWIVLKRGDHTWALSLLSEAAAKRPAVPEIQFHLGTAHYTMGQETQAQSILRSAVAAKEDFPSRERAQRLLEILTIDPRSASPQDTAKLEQALAEDPRDTVALVKLGATAERDGAKEQALQRYRAALAASPKSPALLMRLAGFYADAMGDPAQGYEQAKLARDLAPGDPAIAHATGRLACLAGDTVRGYLLLQESLQRTPGNREVLYDFAMAAYGRGRLAEAEQRMKRALELDGPFARAEEGRQFLELLALSQNPEQAVRSRDKVAAVLEKEPKNLPALMTSAAIHEQEGNPAAARQIYEERLLKGNPDFMPAWRQLAFVCARGLKDPARAFEAGMKAREAFPDDLALERLLGEVAFERQDYHRAAQFLEQNARKLTPDAELLYKVGVAHAKMGHKDQAKSALERALSLKPAGTLAGEIERAVAELK